MSNVPPADLTPASPPSNPDPAVHAAVVRGGDGATESVHGFVADGEQGAGAPVREPGHLRGRAQRLAGPHRPMHREIVGGVHAADGDLVGGGGRAHREHRRPLVANGKEWMSRRAIGRHRVVVALVRLAEARRVRHEPTRVDLVGDGARGDADDIAGEREGRQRHHGAWAVAPEASMASISARLKPASRSTSTLCSPRRGWRRRISPGVLL